MRHRSGARKLNRTSSHRKAMFSNMAVSLLIRFSLRTPNFGRKSLNEIKEVLGQMSLHLGMEIPYWPPENIEELAKKLEDPY